MLVDLKDFFLATPMEGNEYTKVQYKHFLLDIRQQYNLNNKVTKSGHGYINIKKVMYGLKEAAYLPWEPKNKQKIDTNQYQDW